jgi:hypothetical protein
MLSLLMVALLIPAPCSEVVLSHKECRVDSYETSNHSNNPNENGNQRFEKNHRIFIRRKLQGWIVLPRVTAS